MYIKVIWMRGVLMTIGCTLLLSTLFFLSLRPQRCYYDQPLAWSNAADAAVVSANTAANAHTAVSANTALANYSAVAESSGVRKSGEGGREQGSLPSGPSPCKRPLRFAAQPLPVTALASVQGSGNTWMRHLLQQLTGIYTGSIYGRRGDPELWAKGYHGEGVFNGSVIAAKTHGLPKNFFQRAVVVIRNPYDAMFADFNRRASASHVGIAPARAYFEYWTAFSQEYVTRWTLFHEQWAQFQGPVLLINFDELAHSLGSAVEKMADFFKHPSLTMDARCALSGSEGDAKRGEVSFQKSDVFSRNLTRLVNGKIAEVQRLLRDRFPGVSKAIDAWKRNAGTTAANKLTWRPFPPKIM